MRHFHDLLPYITFAFILHGNQAQKKYACFCLIILCELFFSISTRNSIALVISLDMSPLNAYGIPRLMVIILMRFEHSHFSWFTLSKVELEYVGVVERSIQSVKSSSMQPKTIKRFSL